MKQRKVTPLDFEIDALTNSITNAISGEVFETEIVRFTSKDKNQIRKADWVFDWHKELRNSSRKVYKLATINNLSIIHGLISLSEEHDHIFMHLIESAKFNKSKNKLYNGVAGNLIAFSCKLSLENGYNGVVVFDAKSQLVKHYQLTLGAKLLYRNRMYIDTAEAVKLIGKYF
jgi:hypothetical protein